MVYKSEDLAWDWYADVQEYHRKRDNLGKGEKPNPGSYWKPIWCPKVCQGEGMERALTMSNFVYGLLEA